jgi:hypothetical protein
MRSGQRKQALKGVALFDHCSRAETFSARSEMLRCGPAIDHCGCILKLEKFDARPERPSEDSAKAMQIRPPKDTVTLPGFTRDASYRLPFDNGPFFFLLRTVAHL